MKIGKDVLTLASPQGIINQAFERGQPGQRYYPPAALQGLDGIIGTQKNSRPQSARIFYIFREFAREKSEVHIFACANRVDFAGQTRYDKPCAERVRCFARRAEDELSWEHQSTQHSAEAAPARGRDSPFHDSPSPRKLGGRGFFFTAFCLLSNRPGLTKNQPFFLRKQEDFSRRVSN